MTRRKKLTVMIAVLAVVCVITGLTVARDKHEDTIKNTDEVVLSIDPDTVTALDWNYEDTSLSFHKASEDAEAETADSDDTKAADTDSADASGEADKDSADASTDGTWTWDEDAAFPVSNDKMNELLSVFENLGAAFIIEKPEDLSQYGLDAPTCTINITAGDQATQILLGNFSTMDQERYVSTGDGNVYLVKTDPFDTYQITIRDMIQNDETPYFDEIQKITFSGSDNYELHREEDSTAARAEDDVYYTEKDGEDVPLDTTLVEDYCQTITNLDLSDYESYNATDDELKACGLDEPELTAVIDYISKDEKGNETNETFTISIGQNQKELAAQKEAEDKGKDYDGTVTAYARVGESPIIYKISDDNYNKLAAGTYNDLRHQKLLAAGFDNVSQIDIELDDEQYEITSEPGEKKDDDRIYSFNDEEIDITNLRTSVNALASAGFTDEKPDGQLEVGLTFHMDGGNFPEIKVELYRYDADNCLAVIDGKSTCLVPRTSVVDVIEAIHSLTLKK